MIVLLAESKTMASEQVPVNPQTYKDHTPAFEDTADSIMNYFASLPPSEIAADLGISNQLAVKAHQLAYDFPHKLTGYKALDGFTGEAFKALDKNSLSPEALSFAQKHLQIVSSVYGLLKPDDIIKPYRCEFNKPLLSDHKTAIQIFKSKNTINLVNFIKANGEKEIIDLLPGDADKCIDWKIVRAFAKVYKVVFQSVKPNGKLQTPIAKRLKELRGTMARDIFIRQITDFEDLIKMNSEEYIYSTDYSKEGMPVFIVE